MGPASSFLMAATETPAARNPSGPTGTLIGRRPLREPRLPASQTSSPDRGRWVRRGFRLLVGVAFLAVAGLIAATLYATRPESPRSDVSERAATVEAIPIRAVAVSRPWRGFGTARAKRAADVEAEVSGVITRRPDRIDAGVYVRAGEVLVEIEPGEFADRAERARQDLAAARAELAGLTAERESLETSLALADESVEITERELARRVTAAEAGAINEFEVETLERQLAEARRQREQVAERLELLPSRRAALAARAAGLESALSLALRDLDRAAVNAPIDGTLQSVDPDAGDRVTIGEPVARIVDLTLLEVPLRLPISARGDIRVDDPVTLRAGGSDETAWTGRIARVAPEADPQTRTIGVFIEVEQPGAERADAEPPAGGRYLMPGEFVTALVRSATPTERPLVPRVALVADRVVLVTDEGRATLAPVDVAFNIEREFPDLHPTVTQWAALEASDASAELVGRRVVLTNPDQIRESDPLDAVEPQDDRFASRSSGGDGGGGAGSAADVGGDAP